MAGPWEKYSQPSAQTQDDSESANAPWTKYKSPVSKPSDPAQAGQAALEHFGNAASFGYLPQLQSMAARFLPNPNAAVDERLKAQGFSVQQPRDTYLSDRDANIKRLQQQGEDYPVASGAGSVAGALSSAAATSALAPINAVSRIGRIAQAAKGGALIGAISNPGDTEGQVDGLQLGDRLRGAAVGGAIGGAGQSAVEGLSSAAKAVTNLPQALQSKAEERAFKSSGAMLKDYRNADRQGRVNELGRFMLDNGLVKPGMSVEEIAQAAKSLKGEKGQAIQEILNKLDEAGAAGPSAQGLASAVEQKAAPLKDLSTAQPTYKTLQDVAGDIRTLGKEPPIGVSAGSVDQLTGRGTEYLTDPVTGEVMAMFRNGKLSSSLSPTVSSEISGAATAVTPNNLSVEIPGTFRNAQDIKKFVSDQVEASGGWKSLNPTEKNKALQDVYKMVSSKLEESAGQAAEGLGDKELLKNYLDSKAGYRNAKELSDIAGDQSLRQNANRFFSPTDYFSGVGGAMIGAATGGDSVEDKLKHAAIGAGLGLANKAARTYGTPLVSVGLDKAGAMLGRTPLSALGKASAPLLGAAERSPVSMAAAEGILSRPQLDQAALRQVASAPPKGEDLWAQQGLKKLGIQDDDLTQKLMQSPQGKRLLIQASDLPPGSKAFQRVQDQIQKGFGNKK